MSINLTKHIHEPITIAQTENRIDKNNDNQTPRQFQIKSDHFDWIQKQEITQQRNSRLKQVRQQSKEIASKIRDNIRNEKQHQLQIVNDLKNNELYNWQKRECEKQKLDYKSCLAMVGNAHLAAERENERIRKIEEQQAKNRKLALKRGNAAIKNEQMNRLKANKSKRKTTDAVKQVQLVTVSTQVDDSLNTSDLSLTSTSSGSSVISVDLGSFNRQPSKVSKITRDSSLNRKTTINASPKTRARSISPQKVSSVIRSPKKAPISSRVSRSPSKTKQYKPENYMSMSTSTDLSTLSSTEDSAPKITRISEMFNNNQGEGVPYVKQRARTVTVTSNAFPKRPILKNHNVSAEKRSHKEQPLKRTPLKRPPFRVQKTPQKQTNSLTTTAQSKKNQYVPLFRDYNVKRNISQVNETESAPAAHHKVQFYDHANRFSKDYDASLIIEDDSPRTEIGAQNAMEEAKKERELDEIRLIGLAAARKREECRTNDALEKQKIRKDYESMAAKLDELLSSEKYSKAMLTSNELFSQEKLKEIAEEKQRLMNMDFKKILNEPVLITCPKVPATKPTTQRNHIDSSSSDMNVASIDLSSESCSSFLLDYVTTRSNDLTRDINRCRTVSNDDTEKTEKIKALNSLLEKVNSLRKILLTEIQKNEQNVRRGISTTDSMLQLQEIIKEMGRLKEKQQEIMSGKVRYDDSSAEKERVLSDREKLLQEKENLLEQKVKELYLRAKETKAKKILTVNADSGKIGIQKPSSESISSADSEVTPVRIIINTNKNKNSIKPTTNDKKWSELINTVPQRKPTVEFTKVSGKIGTVYPKTPVPAKKPVEKLKTNTSSTSTTLTSYFSPPNAIETDLTKTLKNADKISTAKAKEGASKPNTVNLDPRIAQYITRLLGMSRSSIEQLGFSSISSIATPSSSIVNVSENRKLSISSMSTTTISSESPNYSNNIDECKMERLQHFIAENRNFINELNESFKVAVNGKQSDSIKGIWKEVFNKHSKELIEKPSENSDDQQTTKIKSILRKKPSVGAKPQDKLTTKSKEDSSKKDLISKYDELTANCTKRIVDLDSMITKVREEKHKLLENTLSSAGSIINGQKETITEYLDFPSTLKQQSQGSNAQAVAQYNKSGGDSSLSSDTKILSTQSPEYSSSSPAANRPGHLLAYTKQIGISKDSGVGMSRPVTSSDYRDSPDMRPQNTLEDQNKQQKDLKPLFGDIPRIVDVYSNREQNAEKEKEKEKSLKPPPTAFTRYSPQMEEELAHELSTITEVDTPATSRLNNTLSNEPSGNQTKNGHDLDLLLPYNRFPVFQEYRKAHNMDSISGHSSINNLTTIDSLTLIENLQKMLDINTSQNNDLDYKTFRALSKSLNATAGDGSRIDLSYAKFPPHSDYAKSISGLLDSKTFEAVQSSAATDSFATQKDPSEETTSNSSLPDIVSELKNRNLLRRPFEMDSDQEGTDENILKVGQLLSKNTHQTNPHSAKKQLEKQESKKSSHLKSSNESLIHELEQMGIQWASTLIKKTKEANTGSTSSTSSASLEKSTEMRQSLKKLLSPHKPPRTNTTRTDQSKLDGSIDTSLKSTYAEQHALSTNTQTDMETHAKPINLKQFLARELLKHSSSSSSSSTSSTKSNLSNDSSLASIFLKSYLASSATGNSTPSTPLTAQPHDKQRTSTPVNAQNSTAGNVQTTSLLYLSSTKRPSKENLLSDQARNSEEENAKDMKLFSGESHLSSVRNDGGSSTGHSSADESTSTKANTKSKTTSNDKIDDEYRKHQMFESLIVPTNLQLNLAGPGSSSTTTSTSD